MQDQRRFSRTASEALVEMFHPTLGRIDARARDLSEGGIFVVLNNQVAPPVGTLFQVRIKRHTGAINQNLVAMRVVRVQGGGIALTFA